jgi:hypothetical protein
MSLFESEAHNKRKVNDTVTEPESKMKKSGCEKNPLLKDNSTSSSPAQLT